MEEEKVSRVSTEGRDYTPPDPRPWKNNMSPLSFLRMVTSYFFHILRLSPKYWIYKGAKDFSGSMNEGEFMSKNQQYRPVRVGVPLP